VLSENQTSEWIHYLFFNVPGMTTVTPTRISLFILQIFSVKDLAMGSLTIAAFTEFRNASISKLGLLLAGIKKDNP